ncbi:MAG: HEAT repeat domain-containing protein [Acidobacteriota bacterium]|nr:HEAT repeat domain-containing protein [Acidobacteriota bacterium]
MNKNILRAKISAVLLTFLLSFSQIANARPMPLPVLPQQDDSQKVRKLPPANYVRSRDVDIKHLAIDVRFDWDKEQVIGTTTVDFAPFKNLNKVSLDAAAMTIKSVQLANGTMLKFNYDGKKEIDNLEIMLDRQYKRGEDVSVKIEYLTNYVNKADTETAIGSFGRGVRFIKPTADNPNKPHQIWSQGETEFNRYWFPSYDSPNDFRTTELRATVQKPFTVVSNGKLIETKDNGDNTRTFYWKMDTPYANYLTSIVVGEYAEIKNGEYAGVPIYAYGYPSEAKEVAETTKRVPAMIKFFSEKTGVKYDYPKYSQTMVEDFGGGMENISATTQIEEMIHDERELIDEDSDSLESHELAHQWFGDFVTTREWSDIWLNESFATYFQGLWDEESKGKDFFLLGDVLKNQQEVLGTWNKGNRRPIVTRYYANKDAMFDNYAYPGGGSVLHMLRKHLGEENWWKAINHYLVTNAHQPVSTEDFRQAIEESTGESMDWFFDEWLYKMGHPIFEVTKNYDDATKQLTVGVKQTQKLDPNNQFPQTQYFQTFVDMEIGTPSGTRVERVWIKPQADNTFTFAVDAKPMLVNFDYEGTLLKELTFNKPVDELIYQAANDKDVIGRRWALGELSNLAKTSTADRDKIMTALRNSVANDSLWQLRRAAISEISSIVSPQTDSPVAVAINLDDTTVQMLQKAAKDENSLVRADAIELLGATGDAKFADFYLASLNDRSYTVIDKAALALAKTKSPKAFDALVKLADTASWKGRIKIAGLKALAELGDKRAFAVGLKSANDKTEWQTVRTSALAVVGAFGQGDARAYPLIFESFKKAADNNQFQAMFDALGAIIRIGDARGQEAFDMARAKFKNDPNFLGYVDTYEKVFHSQMGKVGK